MLRGRFEGLETFEEFAMTLQRLQEEFGGHDEHGENPLDMIKKELLLRYPDGRTADGAEVTIP